MSTLTPTPTPTSTPGDFFPDPSTVVIPTPTQDPAVGRSNDLAKSVLEWLFLALAIVVIGLVVLRRLLRLRQTNQPLSHFFRSYRAYPPSSLNDTNHGSMPRTTGLPTHAPFGTYANLHLANVPLARYVQNQNQSHAPIRRTTAADIGAGGRRMGGASDYNGDFDDKDALPAYERHGGPPKYMDGLDDMDVAVGRFGDGNGVEGRFVGSVGVVQGRNEGVEDEATRPQPPSYPPTTSVVRSTDSATPASRSPLDLHLHLNQASQRSEDHVDGISHSIATPPSTNTATNTTDTSHLTPSTNSTTDNSRSPS